MKNFTCSCEKQVRFEQNNDDPPKYYFIFSKVNSKRLSTENIIKDKDKKMIFYQSVFLEKPILENMCQKNQVWR